MLAIADSAKPGLVAISLFPRNGQCHVENMNVSLVKVTTRLQNNG